MRRQETELPQEGGPIHACLHLPAIVSDQTLLTDGQKRNGLCLSTQSLLSCPFHMRLAQDATRVHQENQQPPAPPHLLTFVNGIKFSVKREEGVHDFGKTPSSP